MEKMLINATQEDEIRVALVRDQYLFDLDIEHPSDLKNKANIYKGRITRLEPSLEAAFVEYGSKRQGFLPLKEISPTYFQKSSKDNEKNNIKDLLKEGQELMVQVDKDERGSKGAALTTFIALAGCYLVLMPNSPKSGGISRRIEGEEREDLLKKLKELKLPNNMGVIIRTAGVGKEFDELQWDLDVLINQWKAIQSAYKKQPAPFLIHQEGDVVIRTIRDNMRRSVKEIIIDDQIAYVRAKKYIEQIKPEFLNNLKLYNDAVPLFSRYQIEGQIETAYQREVILPSGGSLVIDRTEALVSIDINSAKATSGSNIENTAFNTNLEAADEIALQLRLRDLGGLIVIDFIDMSASRNQREVENRLRRALVSDRARVQVGRISRFGLLEMSRQRLRLSLGESNQDTCPRCSGRGAIRSIQSHAMSIIRLIEEEALKQPSSEIQVQLPIELATFIFNEKRSAMLDIEKNHNVNLLILPNPYLEQTKHQITSSKDGKKSTQKASFELVSEPELEIIKDTSNQKNKIAAAAKPRPMKRPEEENKGFIKKLLSSLFGFSSAETEKKEKPKKYHKGHHSGKHHHHHKSSQNKNRSRNYHNRNRNNNHNKQNPSPGGKNKQHQSNQSSDGNNKQPQNN